ncbi:DoxX family protein [Mucilaginibacter sp. P25]|uniref:DoxX-like family protein n=1 Tax=Mucilaginibacter gossypii TaxID=551996 RepID=A0A1G8BAX2_9SPHI|nr:MULTISPECIES: DoxX family protein [Mucilaginibacter]QTE35273.1 DoxX family protein [Mucilaginibacter gossypii]RAV51243.1 DoxX family protein [Mucilaginibacter rubeus]SDH30318.1 DoxX-like family protein [Mucilaginibacter gossypii]
MQKEKRIYWIVIIIAMALIVLPSYFAPKAYLIESIHRLGFPVYFGLELDICKIVGAIIILIPAVPVMFKEWAYVAFGILLLSASLGHWLADGPAKGTAPLIPFAILCVSYYYFRKLNYPVTAKR